MLTFLYAQELAIALGDWLATGIVSRWYTKLVTCVNIRRIPKCNIRTAVMVSEVQSVVTLSSVCSKA